MFCPRCSQEQVSAEIKFCSRCGFPLGLVSEIVANGGTLPQLAELYKSKGFFKRRNGLIFAMFWFFFFVLILTPFFGIIGADELAGITAVVGTMGSIFFILISFLLLSKGTKAPEFSNQDLSGFNQRNISGVYQNHLPPQQTQPAQSYAPPANQWKAPNTGELTRPGSITEGTTKLLNKDE